MIAVFVFVQSAENHSLTNLSRTLGIIISTFILVELLFLRVYGNYDVGRRKSKYIVYSISLATFFTDIFVYLQLMIMRTNVENIAEFRLRSPELLILTFAIQLIIIIMFSYCGNKIFFQLHDPEKCCVVTSSQKSLDIIVRAIESYDKQYEIVDVLDYKNKDLNERIKKVDTVFIYDVPMGYKSKILRMCYEHRLNTYINPEIEDIMKSHAETYVLEDIYLLNKNDKQLTLEQRIIKRGGDIVISLLMGIIALPLIIISAIAIKLDDGGPVFYLQERATLNGKIFKVIKLRTMKENDLNSSVTKGDDRITKAGKVLRRFRIDELPQLINVIKGDMSVVGPRPEMLKNVKKYTEELPEFAYRSRVKAGITGYAQILGRYNTTPKDKLIMDMVYIEQFSILRDLQLIFQTVIAVLKPESTEGFEGDLSTSKYEFIGFNKYEMENRENETDL
jgi:exopolysaccharide biosynthesis polyprenyl glycosylphosphotransferase